MYNREAYRAYNYALESCPLCTGRTLYLHTHGKTLLVPTAKPKERGYGTDSKSPNFYHAVGLDRRWQACCSCEHGQKQARRRAFGELLPDCTHVQWLWVFGGRGGKPLEVLRVAGHLAVVETVGDELSFGGV